LKPYLTLPYHRKCSAKEEGKAGLHNNDLLHILVIQGFYALPAAQCIGSIVAAHTTTPVWYKIMQHAGRLTLVLSSLVGFDIHAIKSQSNVAGIH